MRLNESEIEIMLNPDKWPEHYRPSPEPALVRARQMMEVGYEGSQKLYENVVKLMNMWDKSRPSLVDSRNSVWVQEKIEEEIGEFRKAVIKWRDAVVAGKSVNTKALLYRNIGYELADVVIVASRMEVSEDASETLIVCTRGVADKAIANLLSSGFDPAKIIGEKTLVNIGNRPAAMFQNGTARVAELLLAGMRGGTEWGILDNPYVPLEEMETPFEIWGGSVRLREDGGLY